MAAAAAALLIMEAASAAAAAADFAEMEGKHPIMVHRVPVV